MRLIDINELLKHSHDVTLLNGTKHRCIDATVIHEIPTVDAVPVRHGKWIDEGQYADFFPHHAWRCSECGEHLIEIDIPWYKFCPNCGAKMDEERKEE